jgi:hypothetical protein
MDAIKKNHKGEAMSKNQDKTIIERLMEGEKYKGGIVAALFSLNYTFYYDKKSQGVYAIDQGGFVMTKKEMQDIVGAMNIFYKTYDEEFINAGVK